MSVQSTFGRNHQPSANGQICLVWVDRNWHVDSDKLRLPG